MSDKFMIRHISTDWRKAIFEILRSKDRSLEQKRIINKCNIEFMGNIDDMKTGDQENYIEDILVNCGAGYGAIVNTGKAGFRVYETAYKRIKNPPANVEKLIEGISTDKHLLITNNGTGNWGLAECGVFYNLARNAHKILRNLEYKTEVYIYTPDKQWIVAYGKYKDQKTTKRVTDNDIMIMPLYNFAIIGRANI